MSYRARKRPTRTILAILLLALGLAGAINTGPAHAAGTAICRGLEIVDAFTSPDSAPTLPAHVTLHIEGSADILGRDTTEN